MLLGHWMVDGEKMLVFHILNGDSVVAVRYFRLQRGQGDAAAADQGVSCAVQTVTAKRADVEFASQQIGRNVFVLYGRSVHQLN